ncbi:MAG: twin-arginine translocase TatA/TatE family subunit [Planctomycetota bacterium]|nr:twin-arginine translocase TatA/TatE family subunit [Planctomycetota bacterium]
MFGLGPVEICVIGAIAVMIYGKRLPEVGRSVGKGIGELKRSMQSITKEVDISAAMRDDVSAVSQRPARRDDDTASSSPRFDPPT